MVASELSPSARARAEVDHPIVDSDGHVLELTPVLIDYVQQVGGSKLATAFENVPGFDNLRQTNVDMPIEQRRDGWIQKTSWWNRPARNTLDRATAHLPALLYERLDELGIDFTVLYPTEGMGIVGIADEELRRVASRAFNIYAAELFKPYSDRIAPVAVIPMETPEEAIDELEYAVTTLGHKAAMFQGGTSRMIPKLQREQPAVADLVKRADWFAIDSEYDYDTVWAKAVELGVAVTFHGFGTVPRAITGTVTNQVFNRLGAVAGANHTMCKALFLGGVTRRFPTLNIAFLESSVGWACTLLADLIGHWEKRNIDALEHLNPANMDRELLMDLVSKHGDEPTLRNLDGVREVLCRHIPAPPNADEFAACEITSIDDIADLFVPRFYFGCEGDDSMFPIAFNEKASPVGRKLNAIFGSDIGHWDVPDMNGVLREAYEMVEKGLLTPDDFRGFMFTNPVRMHTEMNPGFFKGTRVEAEVDNFLASRV